jgi:phosphatidylinositol alpha-mannosyltransferase
MKTRISKKLRVAMFFSSDPASAGGVQEHVYYLASSLKKLGHRVTVFVPRQDRTLLPYPGMRKIGEFSEFSLPIGYDVSFVNKKETENYRKIISPQKYDLIHIHDPFMPFLSYELLNDLKVPIVTTYHATWEKDSFLDMFRGFVPLFKDSLSKKVKGSIFVSNRTQKCWEEIFNPQTQKTIIANGIDRDLFRFKKKEMSHKIKLLFLARIVPKKGLHLLLKAVKKVAVNHPNIELSVVGTGPDKKRMIEFVKNNKMEDIVKFHGYVKKEDKPRFYREADIFCAPYVNEGFGITLLESMATGTPIVALKNNAFSEVLKNYPAKNLIVKEKSVREMAKALETLIVSDKLRQKIVKWEVEEIKKYDWKKIGVETENFYYKVINNL